MERPSVIGFLLITSFLLHVAFARPNPQYAMQQASAAALAPSNSNVMGGGYQDYSPYNYPYGGYYPMGGGGYSNAATSAQEQSSIDTGSYNMGYPSYY